MPFYWLLVAGVGLTVVGPQRPVLAQPPPPVVGRGGTACEALKRLGAISAGIQRVDDQAYSDIVRLGYRAIPGLIRCLANEERLAEPPRGWVAATPPSIREVAFRMVEEIAGQAAIRAAVGDTARIPRTTDWSQISRSLTRWYARESAKDHSSECLAASAEARHWCRQIEAIRVLPFDVPRGTIGDEVFDNLQRLGDEAVPCLIDRVLDMRAMRDPRMSPPGSVTIGDVGLMVLARVASKGGAVAEVAYPAQVLARERVEGYYPRLEYAARLKNRERIHAALNAWYEREYPKVSQD